MKSIFDHIEKFSNKVALLTEEGYEIKYDKLIEMVEAITINIQPRSLIVILCSNSVDSILMYVGCLRKKIVPILLDCHTKDYALVKIINTYHPQYIWIPRNLNLSIKSIIRLPYRQRGTYNLYQLADESPKLHDKLCLLLSTSGSTGTSKLVRLSYINLMSNTEAIIKSLEAQSTDRAITTLPMNYTYGLSIINTHLFLGGSLVITESSFLQDKFWKIISINNVTTFGGVPFSYEILDKINFYNINVPSLRYITQAGGSMSEKLKYKLFLYCKKKSIRLITMYGQTEATARISYLPWQYFESHMNSIGIPIPGSKLSLISEEGNTIDKDLEVGELVLEGDNVMLGYATTVSDLFLGDSQGRKLYTKDLGYRKDGIFYVIGRKDRFSKILGHRINMDELETLIRNEGIECYSINRNNFIFLFLINDQEEKKVKRIFSKVTNLNSNIVKIVKIHKVPRTPSGKINYSGFDKLI